MKRCWNGSFAGIDLEHEDSVEVVAVPKRLRVSTTFGLERVRSSGIDDPPAEMAKSSQAPDYYRYYFPFGCFELLDKKLSSPGAISNWRVGLTFRFLKSAGAGNTVTITWKADTGYVQADDGTTLQPHEKIVVQRQ